MSGVLSPDAFEEGLGAYLFERSEEARAVRVGEKETSERAAIVARHAHLFTRGQLEVLREAETVPATGEADRRTPPPCRRGPRPWRERRRRRSRR